MIFGPVLFILLKVRGTSYLVQGISCLVGGIFICCPLTLYIPSTFHIPLSPKLHGHRRGTTLPGLSMSRGKEKLGQAQEVGWVYTFPF